MTGTCNYTKQAMAGLTLLIVTGVVAPSTCNGIEYNREIRPLLAENCFSCHGPDGGSRQAELRLDQRQAAVTSGAIVPGKPDASLLIQRILSTDPDLTMPPASSHKSLTAEQKAVLRSWIKEGATYEPHWSFVQPKRWPIPVGTTKSRVCNPIDAFVLDRLERQTLTLASEADKATLLRRITLDLAGIPPTLKELDEYLGDNSPDAYERVVDRLLASPRYGERMALEWLDAARYADTNGYNNDGYRSMWRWRDWVIDAFNRNTPFDRFIMEQLAGDLLPNATLEQRIGSGFNRNHVANSEGGIIGEEYRVEYVADRVATTATVFLGLSVACARCHDHKFDPITQRDYYRLFAYFNQVPEVGQIAYLGNPNPQIKAPTPEQEARLSRLERRLANLDESLRNQVNQFTVIPLEWEAKLPAQLVLSTVYILRSMPSLTLDEMDRLLQDACCSELLRIQSVSSTADQQRKLRIAYLEHLSTEYQKTARERNLIADSKNVLERQIPSTLVMEDMPSSRGTFLLKRGQYDQPDTRQVLTPGVPQCLPPMPAGAPPNRLGLARWITMPENPLTARVAINRFWQMYFGIGLVETMEDFGSQGQTPTYPELLDWLATHFIDTGWNVKEIQRLIVTSATYRQSSRASRTLRERDPQNRLLARGPRFRLSAETIRDNALAIAGLLHEQVGGPSVSPYQPEGIWDDVSVAPEFGGSVFKQDHGESLYRRSMYTFWKRTCPPPGLNSFDAPEREVCVVRRARTNTPLQALVLQNDPTYLEAARKLAERSIAEGGDVPDTRLRYIFRLATSRTPAREELQILIDTFNRQLVHFRSHIDAAAAMISMGEAPANPELNVSELAAYSVVASMILNLDETITKE